MHNLPATDPAGWNTSCTKEKKVCLLNLTLLLTEGAAKANKMQRKGRRELDSVLAPCLLFFYCWLCVEHKSTVIFSHFMEDLYLNPVSRPAQMTVLPEAKKQDGFPAQSFCIQKPKGLAMSHFFSTDRELSSRLIFRGSRGQMTHNCLNHSAFVTWGNCLILLSRTVPFPQSSLRHINNSTFLISWTLTYKTC